MAGMGFVGAGGAAGTYEGLRDWMQGRRQKVVQGQRDEDRLREQALQNQALATEAADREYDIARQRVLDEQNATLYQNKLTEFGRETETYNQDKASAAAAQQARDVLIQGIRDTTDPRVTDIIRLVAIHDAQNGKVSPLIEDALKTVTPKTIKVETVKNGRPVNMYLPEDQVTGQTFEEYREPVRAPQGPQPSHQWVMPQGGQAPVYRQPQAGDTPYDKTPDKGPDVPAAMKMRLSQASEAQKVLTQLKSVFDGDEKTVGAKAFIGPDEGRFNSVRQSLPKWAGGKVNPTFAEFKVASARLKNSIVQAITGAAVGVDEAKRIMDEIPTENDPPELWEVKWKQSLINVENIRNGIYETTGYTPPAMTPWQTQGVTLTPGAGAAGPGRRVRFDAAGNRVP